MSGPGPFPAAWDINLWRDIPVLVGSVFVLAAAVGVLRFPDLYSRLHASSKLVTLGSAGIYLGVAADLMDPTAFTRLLAVLLFQFLTTPLSAYLIAQASYLRGLPAHLWQPPKGRADEWDVFGAAQDFGARRAAQAAASAAPAQSPQAAEAQSRALDTAQERTNRAEEARERATQAALDSAPPPGAPPLGQNPSKPDR